MAFFGYKYEVVDSQGKELGIFKGKELATFYANSLERKFSYTESFYVIEIK